MTFHSNLWRRFLKSFRNVRACCRLQFPHPFMFPSSSFKSPSSSFSLNDYKNIFLDNFSSDIIFTISIFPSYSFCPANSSGYLKTSSQFYLFCVGMGQISLTYRIMVWTILWISLVVLFVRFFLYIIPCSACVAIFSIPILWLMWLFQ